MPWVCFLTRLGVAQPPPDWVKKIQEAACFAPIGSTGSAEKQVPGGRLHVSCCQVCLRSQFFLGDHHLDLPVCPRDILRHGKIWTGGRRTAIRHVSPRPRRESTSERQARGPLWSLVCPSSARAQAVAPALRQASQSRCLSRLLLVSDNSFGASYFN